ncbi:pre-rRNA-processing protein esf1, partial [Dispira simplex]
MLKKDKNEANKGPPSLNTGKNRKGLRTGKSSSQSSKPFTNKVTPVTTDPRFAHVHNDPRFKKVNRAHAKVQVDRRFASKLNNSDFAFTAKVDRYGRRLENNKAKLELKRFYKFDDDENDARVAGTSSESEDESGSDEENDSAVKHRLVASPSSTEDESESEAEAEMLDRGKNYDPARGIGVVSSSDESESDSDDLKSISGVVSGVHEDDEDSEDNIKVPLGDPTHRFAVVRMDWSHLKAVDLFKAFTAFKPTTGVIASVKIYLSEFGKEQLAKERSQGPQVNLSKVDHKADEDSGSDEEEVENESDLDSDAEARKNVMIKAKFASLFIEDDGAEYNQKVLRQYELDKLNYYYAVVECDSVQTATAIYEACDGSEFEASSNLLDLRYIPDGTEFSDSDLQDEAYSAPEHYVGKNFTTLALQHSEVTLTWDDDDPDRLRTTHRQFTKDDVHAMDFKAYLASDHSGSESASESDASTVVSEAETNPVKSKAQAKRRSKYNAKLREKYINLLGQNKKNVFSNGDSDESDEDQDMVISFTPGLNDAVHADDSTARTAQSTIRDNDEEGEDETTLERYMRKQRERRQRRKAEKLAEADSVSEAEHSSQDESGRGSKNRRPKLSAAEKQEEARRQAELDLLLMDTE